MQERLPVGPAHSVKMGTGNMETSKSAVELPSPQAGKVVLIHGGAGDKINVGEPLIVFEVPDNTAGIVGTVPKEEAPKRRVRLSAVLDED